MTTVIKHPLRLPNYKFSPPIGETLSIAVARPNRPISFWQSMAFAYVIVLILAVVCLLWLMYYEQMYHLIGAFGLLFIAGSDFQRDFDTGYHLPIPFLGGVQCCACPLALLDDTGLYWHKSLIDQRSNRWTFDLDDKDGIHRVDIAGYGLVVYFADTVSSLEGTPFLTDNQTLLIATKSGYQHLSLERFCALVNQRAYHFREQQNNQTNSPPIRQIKQPLAFGCFLSFCQK